jgi:charged multivesicular body protein 2A
MGNIWGKDKPLKEIVRENQRVLRKSIRELEKEIENLKRQQKKLEAEIKKSAKLNQMVTVNVVGLLISTL